MLDETRRDLALYRIDKSARVLEDAKMTLEANRFDTAANRAYYAIFHAMRAVFALDSKDYSKHSAVISFFSKDYIKTGRLDSGLGRTIKMASALRNASDYEDYVETTKEETNEAIQKATEFHNAVKEYVERRIAEEQSNI